MALLLLFGIISTVLSAATQAPTPFASYKPNVLTVARYSTIPCVVGRYMVVAGGYMSPSAVSTDYIEVIDLETVSVVATGNLSVARGDYALAKVNNSCIVVGGVDQGTTWYDNVDVIAVNPTNGAISVTAGPTYPILVSDSLCSTDPSTSRVYCFGGNFDYTGSNNVATSAYYYDGSTWTAIANIPVPYAYNNAYYYTTAWFDNRVWLCGGYDEANQIYADFCQVYNPTGDTYVNVSTGFQRSGGVLQVVEYPTISLVWFGGYNFTDMLGYIQTWTGSNGVYTLTTVSSQALFSDSGAGLVFGSSVYSFGGTTVYSNSSNRIPTLYSAYVWNPAAPVDGPFAVVNDPTTVLTGKNPAYSGTALGAYGQKLVSCSGQDNGGTPLSSCFIFDISCLGNSSSGNDVWVSNATFVGCDKVDCFPGYYGPQCTACSCSGQPCQDGYTGDGTCICGTGLYGSSCASLQTCSGNGYPNDGVNGNGSCLCKPTFGGADCATSATCVNGVLDQVSATCVCRPGYFGTACDGVCDCGTAQCNEGVQGDGSCFCAPGYYGTNCSSACNCLNGGICNDGSSGDGSCGCVSGFYGADCGGVCGCQPVVVTPTEIKIFRCDDGATGDGTCVRLNSGSSLSTFLALVVLCLSVVFF